MSKKFTTEELRKFYFSKATNYDSFANRGPNDSLGGAVTPGDVNLSVIAPVTPIQTKQAAKRQLPTPAATPAVDLGSANARQDVTATIPAGTLEVSAAGPRSTAPAAGSALAAARNATGVNPAASASAAAAASAAGGDGVSPAYIAFLRQQQDLVKMHCSIDELVHAVLEFAAARRAEKSEKLSDALALMHEAEQSTAWHWKSKYTIDTLCTDAQLEVPQDALKRAEDIPNIVDLQHQQQLLVRLKQQYCTASPLDSTSSLAQDFKPTLENGIRRFDRLIKEFSASQLDAAPIVRTSDDILVQLDHVLSQQKLSLLLQDVNERILVISQKHKECCAARDAAHEEGFMDAEEREAYRLADLGEELANTQVEKVRILARLLDEVNVNKSVRDTYSKKARDEILRLEEESEALRKRCETDLARLYRLRQDVENTEKSMLEKTERQRIESDAKLQDIMDRQSDAWDQVGVLLKLIRQLELDRHNEIKLRMEAKVKDESRRNEYTAFNGVLEGQATDYDRTIKNCDTRIHCAKLMGEFLHSGFFVMERGLEQRGEEVSGALLAAQKEHLDIYRSLLFTLGDIEYRKERRGHELGENIQAAHIQQELCSDSLNPNAKKFSDAKKDLLKLRDDLQLEIGDIKDRQNAASQQFHPTSAALSAAGVVHTHPLNELEDRRLNTRAKMVEYKSMALGRGGGATVKQELDLLKQSLNETRKVITKSNSSALSTVY